MLQRSMLIALGFFRVQKCRCVCGIWIALWVMRHKNKELRMGGQKVRAGLLALAAVVCMEGAMGAAAVQSDLRHSPSQPGRGAAASVGAAPSSIANLSEKQEHAVRLQATSAQPRADARAIDEEAAAGPGLMVASWAIVALIALRRMFS